MIKLLLGHCQSQTSWPISRSPASIPNPQTPSVLVLPDMTLVFDWPHMKHSTQATHARTVSLSHSPTALCRWTQLTQHASALCVPPNPTTSMCVQHSNGCALCRTTHSCIKHAHCTQPCSQSHCMSLPPAQPLASDSRQCATCLQWILSLHAPF